MRILLYSPKLEGTIALQKVLGHSSLHIDTCDTEERLLYLALTERYAAIILAHIPLAEELQETYKALKKAGCTSVCIVVSTIQSALLRARLLEAGVDYYFIEPYSYTRLVSSILIHEYTEGSAEVANYQTNHFQVDVLRRCVAFQGEELNLTKREFEMLAYFLRKRGIVLSRVQIWEEIWGYEEYPLANTVDVHVNRLRKKLPAEARRLLASVYGIGYQMAANA